MKDRKREEIRRSYSPTPSEVVLTGHDRAGHFRWHNETRPRVTALIDGIKVNLLYDTGDMSSCLTPETYARHFSHKKLNNRQNVSASAAGNVDLGVLGTAVFRDLRKGRHPEP